jgi:hypothetical protein
MEVLRLDVNTNMIQILNGFSKLNLGVASLLLQNENLFKLLWYEDIDPLAKYIDEETMESMVYEYDSRGNRNPNCRIFYRKFTGDTETSQRAQIRIYPIRVKPSNVYYGDLMFNIDVIVHMGIDKIKNEERRHRLASEVMQSLNGQQIQMVQNIVVKEMFMFSSSAHPQFDGWTLVCATGVSAA